MTAAYDGVVDLLLALLVIKGPVDIDRDAAVFAGALTPVVVPSAWLSPQARARWLSAKTDAPLADRVAAALSAKLPDEAWRLVIARPQPPSSDPSLEVVIERWIAAEIAERGLPGRATAAALVVGVDGPPAKDIASAASGALADVAAMFEATGWPRWIGPVIVVADRSTALIDRERTRLTRPALPIVRIVDRCRGDLREELADRFADLALSLAAPPPGGWPRWLVVGMREVAAAKARGEGPSPQGMLAIRAKAGARGVADALNDRLDDAALAEALCAPLVHSRRRHLLGNLLELLRHSVGSETALRIAYDLDAERLARDK
jgi:hypothetical protein